MRTASILTVLTVLAIIATIVMAAPAQAGGISIRIYIGGGCGGYGGYGFYAPPPAYYQPPPYYPYASPGYAPGPTGYKRSWYGSETPRGVQSTETRRYEEQVSPWQRRTVTIRDEVNTIRPVW